MIDLKPEYLREVKNILRQHVPEITVWVFGSRVNGKTQTYADLDLALITDEPLSANRFWALKNAFSVSDLPILVDVVDWSEISDEFKEIVKANYEVAQEKSGRDKAIEFG